MFTVCKIVVWIINFYSSGTCLLVKQSQVSKYLSNPNREHFTAIKKIFQYLKGTKDYGIKIESTSFQLEAYSDAEYVGDVDRRCSTSGYVTFISNAPVTWRSQKHKSVSLLPF